MNAKFIRRLKNLKIMNLQHLNLLELNAQEMKETIGSGLTLCGIYVLRSLY
ncbi:hypothetical protein GNY06_12720 [Elizabethkingia argentiflava]|uniref:Uncharacterized protein n=1 Tax=Elizabethkingia argenteiflava TaxID=2681556 RepID=A0A845Q1J6_9FLAO|nr:hypothetical protein [Elizabethkingia argenteiflava]NAW52200.1 hypothetical protein [Elizabethkingia argenteiflava]